MNKTRHEGEDNNVMAGGPPTCNPVNAKRVGPRPKGLQRVWFSGERKRAYFLYPARTSFGRCFAGKASLPKISSKPTWGT